MHIRNRNARQTFKFILADLSVSNGFCFQNLANINCPSLISIHYTPIPLSKVIKMVKNNIMALDAEAEAKNGMASESLKRARSGSADLMEDQVDGETAAARRDELMLLQQKIAFEKAEAAEGRVMDVMVEGFLPDEQVYVCRTEGDAPGVDGYLFLDTERNLMSGDFVRVLVTGASGYDLVGELLEDEGEWEDDTDD